MNLNNDRICPGCDSANGNSIGMKNGFELLVCADCESIYAAQLPKEHQEENYDEYYTIDNLSTPAFIKTRVSEILYGFSKYRQTNRFLDIGFGSGTVLEVAKDQEWEVSGLEVSKPAVDQARNNGFEVFHGDLLGASYPDHHFDVITASEILEHLLDPQSFLKEVSRILRPGGLFWATTPNANGLSFRLMKRSWSVLSPPEHVQLYSKKAIIRMFSNAGFGEIKLQTFGLNPAEILQHYRRKTTSTEEFDRVGSAYDLNERLMKSPIRKTVKNVLNQTLNLFKIGDSLKIFAKTKLAGK